MSKEGRSAAPAEEGKANSDTVETLHVMDQHQNWAQDVPVNHDYHVELCHQPLQQPPKHTLRPKPHEHVHLLANLKKLDWR